MKILPLSDPQAIQEALQRAQRVLKAGGVVVIPTDTVYGLTAQASNAQAIARLYQLKVRSENKSIAVLLGDFSQWQEVAAELPKSAHKLAKRYWPGGMTLIVPKLETLPPEISHNEKIGIRIPDLEIIRELIRLTGPLATTSANLSGEPPAKCLADLPQSILEGSDLILDGGTVTGGIASTVIDCTEDPVRILREGALSPDAIFAEAAS